VSDEEKGTSLILRAEKGTFYFIELHDGFREGIRGIKGSRKGDILRMALELS
jgi:hypothetical protein